MFFQVSQNRVGFQLTSSQRFAATRSWRFLSQMLMRRTKLTATTKLSHEALNRQFFVGAVTSWASVSQTHFFHCYRQCP